MSSRTRGAVRSSPAARPWSCPRCGALPFRACMKVVHGVEEMMSRPHPERTGRQK